jgi:hypothetical protein
MRKMIFVVAFVAFGFVASEASAVTVINVSQDEVKKQCNGRDKCMTVCGSTYCDYVCDKSASQCTVTVFFKKPRGRVILPSSAGAKARVQ